MNHFYLFINWTHLIIYNVVSLIRCVAKNVVANIAIIFKKFKVIAEMLLLGQALDEIYRDHKLVGNYVGRKECHIEPNWLLIYKIEETQMIFERMGTHSDLFK